MFENIISFFKKLRTKESKKESSDTAKERLHLVLMQDRANVSADFLELMKQEIIEVIKKYIDIDEKAIDVRLTNKANEDGTVGAPALYANIPIVTIKNEARKANVPQNEKNETEPTENSTEKPEDKNEENVKQEEAEKQETLSQTNQEENVTENEQEEKNNVEEQKQENIEVEQKIEKQEEKESKEEGKEQDKAEKEDTQEQDKKEEKTSNA